MDNCNQSTGVRRAALDWWFARQLVTSPLRVPNVQDADMVFVPATIRCGL